MGKVSKFIETRSLILGNIENNCKNNIVLLSKKDL